MVFSLSASRFILLAVCCRSRRYSCWYENILGLDFGLTFEFGGSAVLTNSYPCVFVTLHVFFVWWTILANEDTASTAMVLATEYSKKFSTDLARIKSFIWNPFGWLKRWENTSLSSQTIVKADCSRWETSFQRIHHTIIEVSVLKLTVVKVSLPSHWFRPCIWFVIKQTGVPLKHLSWIADNHRLSILLIFKSNFIVVNILKLPYICTFNCIFFGVLDLFTSKLQISSARIRLIASDIIRAARIIHKLVNCAPGSTTYSHYLHLRWSQSVWVFTLE